jgi:hypothetical protein
VVPKEEESVDGCGASWIRYGETGARRALATPQHGAGSPPTPLRKVAVRGLTSLRRGDFLEVVAPADEQPGALEGRHAAEILARDERGWPLEASSRSTISVTRSVFQTSTAFESTLSALTLFMISSRAPDRKAPSSAKRIFFARRCLASPRLSCNWMRWNRPDHADFPEVYAAPFGRAKGPGCNFAYV